MDIFQYTKWSLGICITICDYPNGNCKWLEVPGGFEYLEYVLEQLQTDQYISLGNEVP